MPQNIFYPEDYKFGTEQEELVLPKIQNFFGREIKKSTDPFSKHDFFDEEYTYEMKSRKNNYNKYPTTLMTADKIVGEKKLILLFNFTDGLYYIEYDRERFSKYDQQTISRAGLSWNAKNHYYIPINDLTPIKV